MLLGYKAHIHLLLVTFSNDNFTAIFFVIFVVITFGMLTVIFSCTHKNTPLLCFTVGNQIN